MSASPENILKSSGLRRTRTREILLKELLTSRRPRSCEELLTSGRKHCPRLNLVTVYRNMRAFTKAGLVNASRYGGDTTLFEYAPAEKHRHHVICIECQSVETIEHCGLDRHTQVLRRKGYQKIHHRLEFYGVCRKCSLTLG